MKQIVLASANPGKIKEFQHLFKQSSWQLVPQVELGIESPPEPASTFVENALIKARHAAQQSGLPAIADDSGLVIDALKGAPGVRSARYAGEKATDAQRIAKLLWDMKDVPEPKRIAHFYSLVVLLRRPDDPSPLICQGVWSGSVLFSPFGKGGFGYDPIFYLPTHHCSAAELPTEEKNRLSHRGQAMEQLTGLLKDFIIF